MPPLVRTYEEMLFAPPSDASAAVAFLSEVGYDTEYFDAQAYATLMTALRTYPGLTGVVIDGAITRLDRPEFLNDALTYWLLTSIEEAKNEMTRVPSHKHGTEMLQKQLVILSERLGELRATLPNATIVYSFHDDDLQHTVSMLMNQLMLAHVQSLNSSIREYEAQIRERKEACTEAKERIDALAGTSGSEAARERKNAKRRLERNGDSIDRLRGEIERVRVEQRYFRENKTRALHQVMTRTFMTNLFAQVQEICTKHQVVLITHDALLRFGGLAFLYSHSGHKTWGVIKKRREDLREGVQHIMHTFFQDPMMLLPGLAHEPGADNLYAALRATGIDVVVESGHSGAPFTSVQKCANLTEEINFRNAGMFDGVVSNQYVRVLSVMPFESRRKLSSYASGKQAVRLSGGKAGGSRSSRAMERYHAGVPAGLTILTKGESGRTGVHWVRYADFERGIGIQPTKHIIASSSDEHVGGPFWHPVILEGWMRMIKEWSDAGDGFPFLTQSGRLVGVILPGDQSDANTNGWPYAREKQNHHPGRVHRETLTRLARLQQDPGNAAALSEMAAFVSTIAGGGTVESMNDILDWVTDYMWNILQSVLPKTMLQFALVRIPGNHTGSALARLGMNSNCYLQQRLKVAEIPYYLVGRPELIDPQERETARVFLGGFGISLVGSIENYGRAVDGSQLFGPIKLLVNHNPKGPEMHGLASAGRGAGADVVVSGHVHDFYVMPYLMGKEDVGFAVRVPTLEGVTDVELYYAGQPRVQGAILMSMPVAGQFAEEFIFMHQLREEGQRLMAELAAAAMSNAR